MAGRPSVVLRNQFEVAQRIAELNETGTSVADVHEKIELAISIVREKLDPIDEAVKRNQIAWLEGTFPDWKTERRLLRDEIKELERLRDYVELFLNRFLR